MKSIYKFSIAGLLILFSVTSCFNDLDPKSLGPNSLNSATVYQTNADFKSGLAKVYAAFSLSGQQGPSGNPDIINVDEGFATYLREYWNVQELPTDEAVYSWAEDGNIRPLHYQTWTPTNTFTQMMYTRILLAVTYANEFIRAAATSSDAEVATFAAEARYLRALAYYHALDMFGNPSFVTEADLPGAFFPQQIKRADLFAYIESELSAIEPLLGAPRFEYGRADKGALWMLQAKMYLNAQVYIGAPRYTECLTAVNKVLAAGYTLAANYLHNFRADNDTSPEMIFAFNYDARRSQSYGGMDYIIHGCIVGSMTPGNYGVSSGWSQNRVTREFLSKFPDITGATDRRAQFYTDGQSLVINDVAVPTDGIAVTKFTNKTLAGGAAPSGGSPDFVDTDFPIFRLADAYLMYAEAVVRGGAGGTPAQALTYVNALRTRAHNGATTGNITQGQLTLSFILDERGRELYWECTRRTDLVRYGLLTGGGYLWQWKGNAKDGIATPTYLDLFPIPAREITGNPNLVQNPGYTGE